MSQQRKPGVGQLISSIGCLIMAVPVLVILVVIAWAILTSH